MRNSGENQGEESNRGSLTRSPVFDSQVDEGKKRGKEGGKGKRGNWEEKRKSTGIDAHGMAEHTKGWYPSKHA